MDIRFSGVTFLRGDLEKASDYCDNVEAADGTAYTTTDMNDTFVVVDKEDAFQLAREVTGTSLPEEFMGKSDPEIRGLVARNPEKYDAQMERWAEAFNGAISNPIDLMEVILTYAFRAKERGQDVLGEPVKELNL